MRNKILNFLKATIISLIVAFLFVLIVCYIYKLVIKEEFETAASLIQMMAVKTEDYEPTELVLEDNKVQGKPAINSEYGRLKIAKIDVDLPIFYGDSLEVLKGGIGHHLTSYLPGEGGSILCMGHNYKKYLQRLPEVEVGDEIIVETSYGTFNYKVYDTKIVGEYDVDEAPIQKDEEIFMLYTCYPTYRIRSCNSKINSVC